MTLKKNRRFAIAAIFVLTFGFMLFYLLKPSSFVSEYDGYGKALLIKKIDGKLKLGLLDSLSGLILEPQYEQIKLIPLGSDGKVLIGVRFKNKWRLKDEYNNFISSDEYDELGENTVKIKTETLLAVKKDGKWVTINMKGNLFFNNKTISPTAYESDGFIEVEANNKKGLINLTGAEVLPILYDRVYSIDSNHFNVELKEKCGIVSAKNEPIVPFIYDFITLPNHESENKICIASRKVGEWRREYFLIDIDGAILKGPFLTINDSQNRLSSGKYRYGLNYFFCYDLFSSGQFYNTIFNGTGELVGTWLGEHVYAFNDGLTPIKDISDNTWGYLDTIGNVAIYPQYQKAQEFSEGLAAVKYEYKYGFINIKGQVVVPFKYEYVYAFENGFAIVIRKSKRGFIDNSGNEITLIKYDNVGNFYNGIALVEINLKKGLINTKGKEILPIKYAELEIWDFNKSMELYDLNENKSNEEKNIMEGTFFSDEFTIVKVDGKFGILDIYGKFISEIKYDYISFNSEFGLFNVKIGNKIGYRNLQGDEIWED